MTELRPGGNSACTVISRDFALVAKLQAGGSLEVRRVMSRLRPGLGPEGEEEMLVIDLTGEEDASVEEFLAGGSEFSVVVLLAPDGQSAARWQNRGVVVVSLAEWMDADEPPRVEAGAERKRVNVTAELPVVGRQTVVVFNPKGGVGRTTVAVNLAARAGAALGLDTVIVDLDIGGGDVALHLGLTEEPTVVDLAAYGEDVTGELVREFASTYRPSGISVLPAPGRPELVELAPWERLAPVIRSCARTYDLVVVDTPGDPASEMSYRVLEEATYVLAPVTLDVTAPRRLKMALKTMQQLSGDFPDRVRMAVNRSWEGAPVTCRDVEEFLGRRAVARLPEDAGGAVAAVSAGRPLVLGRDEGEMVAAIDDLLEDILAVRVSVEKKPLWKKMLGYVKRWPGRRD